MKEFDKSLNSSNSLSRETQFLPLYEAAEKVQELACDLGVDTDTADYATVRYAVELVCAVASRCNTLVAKSQTRQVLAADARAVQISRAEMARQNLVRACAADPAADPLAAVPLQRERLLPRGKLPHQTLPDLTGWTAADWQRWEANRRAEWANPEVAVAHGENPDG